MLDSNTMENCHQINDMYKACTKKETPSMICEAATRYFIQCSSSDKWEMNNPVSAELRETTVYGDTHT